MQKRFEERQKLPENRLTNLEFTLNDIGNNEAFTTALMKATDSAIKTAETSKREYLANAVLNSLTIDVNESIMMIYLGFMDSYTLRHIKVLNFFENLENLRSHQNIYVVWDRQLQCCVKFIQSLNKIIA